MMLFVILAIPNGYRVRVVSRKDGTFEIRVEPIGRKPRISQPRSTPASLSRRRWAFGECVAGATRGFMIPDIPLPEFGSTPTLSITAS